MRKQATTPKTSEVFRAWLQLMVEQTGHEVRIRHNRDDSMVVRLYDGTTKLAEGRSIGRITAATYDCYCDWLSKGGQ